jgi:hypothetical protein
MEGKSREIEDRPREATMGLREILKLPLVRKFLDALGVIARAAEPWSAAPTQQSGQASKPSKIENRSDEPGDIDSGGVYFGLSLADLGYGNLVGTGDRRDPNDVES